MAFDQQLPKVFTLPAILQIGRSPLHLAARNGHTEVVAALIAAQAAVNAIDDEGMTPLAVAAAKGHTLAAGELIWGHADVNATVQGSIQCQVTCSLWDLSNHTCFPLNFLIKEGVMYEREVIACMCPVLVALFMDSTGSTL